MRVARMTIDLRSAIELLAPSMARLDGDVITLRGAVEPLGRLAGRVPGGKRR